MKVLAALICIGSVLPARLSADPPPDLQSLRIVPQEDYAPSALEAYGAGYAFLERAKRFEHDEAAAGTETSRTRAQRGAVQAYEDAFDSFTAAARADERMYEAHTWIGYVNRKLGRYDESLAAYEIALRLKSDYAPAIEYQGEAYLALDRFDAARINFLRLYALDQAQAGKLLHAMRGWLAERQIEPRTVSVAQLRAAADWLQDQVAASPPGDDAW